MKKILGQLSRKFHKDNADVDPDQLSDLYEQLITTLPNDLEECLNMLVNMIVSYPGFVKEVYDWTEANNHLTEQIFTIRIKSMTNLGNIDEAILLIEQMKSNNVKPHVRTFLPLCNLKLNPDQYNKLMSLIKEYGIVPTTELFSYLIKSAPKGYSDIQWLVEWAGQHCNVMDQNVFQAVQTPSVTDGVCHACQTTLKIIDLTSPQKDLMLQSVFDNNNSIIRWVQTRDYDIVIDGANVAHYNNSPFDPRKVTTMINMINKVYNSPKILLVFSVCRKRITRGFKWPNVDLYYTKAGTNDDLSWLYAAIYYPKIWCITNDQMRDHVYHKFIQVIGRNVVDLWMERNVVTYSFNIIKGINRTYVQITLGVPLPYSIRPQYSNGYYHLPIGKDRWVCGTV